MIIDDLLNETKEKIRKEKKFAFRAYEPCFLVCFGRTEIHAIIMQQHALLREIFYTHRHVCR